MTQQTNRTQVTRLGRLQNKCSNHHVIPPANSVTASHTLAKFQLNVQA